MNEALIAAGATLLVCLINNYFQAQQAEKKQDLHNNAVSRLYEVEKRLGVDEEKIKVVNHRIADLEQTCDK